MAEKWTKTSSPPSTAMKPYPFSLLNHLTVPCATLCILTSLPPASAVPVAEIAPYRTPENYAPSGGPPRLHDPEPPRHVRAIGEGGVRRRVGAGGMEVGEGGGLVDEHPAGQVGRQMYACLLRHQVGGVQDRLVGGVHREI